MAFQNKYHGSYSPHESGGPGPGSANHGDMEMQRERVPPPYYAENGDPDNNEDDDEVETRASQMIYKINENPPWYMSLILGLQHYLTMIGATIAIPFILCPAMCIEDSDPARGSIISTLLFVSGIVTFLQATFGVRLPIVQGGTFSFLAPTLAILSLKKYKCPDNFAEEGWGNEISAEEKTENWQIRMRVIQGSIIIASLFQVVIGYCGIVGFVLRFITPLTIAPAVAMVGLSLFPAASYYASKDWPISMATVIAMMIFSQYLRNIKIPFTKNNKIPVFGLFPVLISILSIWSICGILTASDVFEEGRASRTDSKSALLERAAWFSFPYPFQWGWPTISLAGIIGMIGGVIASAIESIGDYFACARLAGARPPPIHAVNRGIGMEGIGCIIAGLFGTGNGTTSYSENIGAIGVTKVGSRRVIQAGALLMILFGLFPKIGAIFLLIPEPIVGGLFIIMFGLVSAVGLSSLQFIDLNSARNLFILGFSIFFSLMLPRWMDSNKGVINTGSTSFNQILEVMLKTGMFLAGVIGCFLDNTIPGTPEERGLVKWKQQTKGGKSGQDETYDLPFGMNYIRKWKWTQYIPSSPTYKFS